MEKKRLYYLDGLRGWGALIVYFFHLASFLFYKGKFPFTDTYLYKTPLAVFTDGASAIFLFFLLSGFSLSYKFFKNQGDYNYLREAAQYRYFRLLIPVFFAILIPYTLIKFHLMFNTNAFFGAYATPFDFYSIFEYTFVALPFKLGANHSLYGPIFWTIYLELTASLFIFLFLALFGTRNLRFLLYAIIIIPLYKNNGVPSFYLLFFVGVFICDLFCIQKNNEKNSVTQKSYTQSPPAEAGGLLSWLKPRSF